MARTDNYLIQAQQAKSCFLTYDAEALAKKLNAKLDADFLYTTFFGQSYRVSRKTGDIQRLENGAWQDGNSYEEVMTLLDLICDSREDRHVSGRWKAMQDFGLQFHQKLLEDDHDPWAERFQNDLPAFRRACLALGGKPLPVGDAAYAFEIFDGLGVAVQLWLGDDEFTPNLRFLWDENADQYIRYETMYFAKALLLSRIAGQMKEP